MKRSIYFVLTLLIIGGLALSFRTLAEEKSAGAGGPDGAALFRSKCSMCHGLDGKGFAAIKSPDFTDPKVQAAITDKEAMSILRRVEEGVDKPEDRLVTGQVGTVVEVLAPDVYEVEFLDSKGGTIAVTELNRSELLLLQHEPVLAT